MKRFSDIRKIKVIGDIVKENNSLLSPNTLDLGRNKLKESIYPTQFFIENGQLRSDLESKNKEILITKKPASQYMETPDLSIPLSDVLNIYDVNTYDELIQLIKKLNIEEKNKFIIYRLVNTYTRLLFNELKKSNNSLIKIFKIIFDNNKINEDKLSLFLKKWFEKNKDDDFDLNICNDVKYFLSNKYESN